MEIIGYILIAGVIIILFRYFKWSQQEAETKTTDSGQEVTVVVEGSYAPNVIRMKKGEKLTIIFDRREAADCSKKVIFQDLGISKELPDFEKTKIEVNPKKTGEFPFTCEMGMYQGKLVVEE